MCVVYYTLPQSTIPPERRLARAYAASLDAGIVAGRKEIWMRLVKDPLLEESLNGVV
jgi:hypothetical protein